MKNALLLLLAGCLSLCAPLFAQNNFLDFNQQQILVPHSPELGITGDMTIEFWVYLNSYNSFSGILGKTRVNQPQPYDIYHSGGRMELLLGNGFTPSGYFANSATPLCSWTHLAVVVQGNTVSFYQNGVADGSSTMPFDNRSDGGLPLYIGSRADGATKLDGKMDEMRIWNVARSQTDIANNMNSSLVGSEAGLVLYYGFDQGTCAGNNAGLTTETDLTSFGNDGTLQGFALTGCSGNYVCAGNCPAGCGNTGTLPGNGLAAPPPVPTVSEWGLILLGLGIVAFGSAVIVRRSDPTGKTKTCPVPSSK